MPLIDSSTAGCYCMHDDSCWNLAVGLACSALVLCQSDYILVCREFEGAEQYINMCHLCCLAIVNPCPIVVLACLCPQPSL